MDSSISSCSSGNIFIPASGILLKIGDGMVSGEDHSCFGFCSNISAIKNTIDCIYNITISGFMQNFAYLLVITILFLIRRPLALSFRSSGDKFD